VAEEPGRACRLLAYYYFAGIVLLVDPTILGLDINAKMPVAEPLGISTAYRVAIFLTAKIPVASTTYGNVPCNGK
jgi:hypothetical protein